MKPQDVIRASGRDDLQEKSIVTFRVAEAKNVFSLRSTSSRAAVSFQQRRAFELVNALIGQQILKAGMRVGIVGGGFSGLTVQYALESHKIDSMLYEALDTPIATQLRSDNKMLHPDYNRWPNLGIVRSVTDFPGLNWSVGSADEVSKGVYDGFKKREIETFDREDCSKMLLGTKVKSVEEVPEESGVKVRYHTKGERGIRKDQFDLLILADGQGFCEKEDPHSYWSNKETEFGAARNKVCKVFGLGDSGLLSLFGSLVTSDGALWPMMLELVSACRLSAWCEPLEGYHFENKDRFSHIEAKIQEFEATKTSLLWTEVKPRKDGDSKYIPFSDAISERERDFYTKLLETNGLYEKVTDVVSSVLIDPEDVSQKPILVGMLTEPFEPTSAPINKILLAWLYKNQRFEYQKKTPTAAAKSLENALKDMKRNRDFRVFNCTGRGKTTERLKLKIKSKLDPDTLRRLDARVSEILSHNQHKNALDIKDFLTSSGVKSEQKHIDTELRPVVEDFLRKIPGVALSRAPMLIDGTDKAEWRISLPLNAQDRAKVEYAIRQLGGLEPDFWGFPIKWVPRNYEDTPSSI